jgi:K+/H+ antiporter YhaU regulatory subunit KhtT
VSPVLADAQRGLQIVAESDPQEAVQNVGLLQEDAGRLAEVIAPSSIASRWNSGLNAYAKSLQALRSAYENGTTADRPLADTTSTLKTLNDIVAGR